MKLATRFGKAKGKAVKERIADALSQVGLSGYERRKVYTLSGGEQQRVALAKIIAKSPDIILADEPTGGLDERNRSYVMDILKELNRQRENHCCCDPRALCKRLCHTAYCTVRRAPIVSNIR